MEEHRHSPLIFFLSTSCDSRSSSEWLKLCDTFLFVPSSMGMPDASERW